MSIYMYTLIGLVHLILGRFLKINLFFQKFFEMVLIKNKNPTDN